MIAESVLCHFMEVLSFFLNLCFSLVKFQNLSFPLKKNSVITENRATENREAFRFFWLGSVHLI